jgi:septum formation protein
MRLVLASASPRRKELLSQIGIQFDVSPVDIDETPFVDETPSTYVSRMATEKALSCLKLQPPDDLLVILGSDTSVIVDNEILGKPVDFIDSKKMLRRLSGRSHQVMTSVCVVINRWVENTSNVDASSDVFCKLVITDVQFKIISDAQIEAYWNSGEPQDKAGSYGIQGFGAVFVERIHGSYSAVVGLPLAEVADMLDIAGVPIWQTEKQ